MKNCTVVPLFDRLPAISDTTILRRYLPRDRYDLLCETRRLYFASISSLRRIDPAEGKAWHPSMKRSAKNASDELGCTTRELVGYAAYSRNLHRVSCWNMPRNFDEWLWDANLSAKPAVCIQTTVGRLRAAISNRNGIVNFSHAKIAYCDSSQQIDLEHMVELLACKRRVFASEEEYRLFWRTNPSQSHLLRTDSHLASVKRGHVVDVDLNTLIQHVFHA